MRLSGAIRAKKHAAQPCMLPALNRYRVYPARGRSKCCFRQKQHPNQDLAKALPSANTELGALTRIGLTTGAVEMARRTTGLSSI